MDWKDIAGSLVQAGAPIIGGALGGPLGGMIGSAIGNVVASSLGVESTPEAVETAIRTRPPEEIIARLSAAEHEAQVKWPAIAQIAQAKYDADTKKFIAGISGDESARVAQLELVKVGSPIQYTPIAVSIIVMVGYFVVVIMLLARPFQVSSDFKDILIFMFGALQGGFVQVISFWLGSSAGSQSKDTALRDIAATSVVQAGTTATAAAAAPRKR